MEDTSSKEVRSGRAPRKRATRKSSSASKRVVSVPPKVEPVKEKPVATTPARKAPTPISADKRKRNAGRRQLAIILAIFVVGIGSSVAIGYSDKGVIDVGSVISERNQKAKDSGDTSVVSIPVQNTNDAPDGGLVGRGDVEPKARPVVAEVATTTATSSDSDASSTEEPGDEDVEAESEEEVTADAEVENQE